MREQDGSWSAARKETERTAAWSAPSCFWQWTEPTYCRWETLWDLVSNGQWDVLVTSCCAAWVIIIKKREWLIIEYIVGLYIMHTVDGLHPTRPRGKHNPDTCKYNILVPRLQNDLFVDWEVTRRLFIDPWRYTRGIKVRSTRSQRSLKRVGWCMSSGRCETEPIQDRQRFIRISTFALHRRRRLLVIDSSAHLGGIHDTATE